MLFCTCCLASVALARVGTKERHEQRAGSHWSPVKSALQLVCICRVNLLSRQNHKTSVPASLKGAPPCRVLMFAPWLPVWSCWPREGQSEKQPGWPGPGASDEASTQPPPPPPPPPPEAGMLLRLVLAHEIRTLEGNLLHNKGRMAHFGDN